MKSLLRPALLAALAASSVQAQSVPRFINYQGRVTDSTGAGLGSGSPVNRKMIFRIFDAATAGNRIWSEEQTVTVSNGEFSVLLGNGIDATYNSAVEAPRPSLLDSFGGADRYLELVVDDGNGTFNNSDSPIAPRQRLTSTAYSMRAATADSVTSGADFKLKDANSGLGWYGAGRLFNGQSINGPVLYGYSGGALGSNQDGTQRTALQWNGNGNVGIGTAASDGAKLTLNGVLGLFDGATRSKNAGINTEAGGAVIQMGVNEDGGNRFGGNYDSASQGGMMRVDSRNGSNLFSFFGRSAGSTGGVSPLMTMTSGGKVGIGTESPSQNLDVVGSIRVNNGGAEAPTNSATGGAGSRVILWPGNSGETPFGFGISPSSLWSSVPAGATFRWHGGTTERMNLNGGNGNLLVTGNVTAANFSTAGSLGVGTVNAGKIVMGSYSSAADNILSVRTLGANNYVSGVELKHHDGNYGFSLLSDERNGNGQGYGFHLTSIHGGTTSERLFIHATSGDVGIGNIAPTSKLDVSGTIKAKGKPATVGDEELRIVRGKVNSNATVAYPAGHFTVTKGGSDGYYVVNFNNSYPNTDLTVTVTPEVGAGQYVYFGIRAIRANGFDVELRHAGGGGQNASFFFTAVGPR